MAANFDIYGGVGYWEGAGQVVGIWLGATVMLATTPIIAADGPQPGPADYAWYYANLRNTNYLRKQGGMIGEQVDAYLADPVEAVESWSSGGINVEIPTKQNFAYSFKEGQRIEFGSFLEFGTLEEMFGDIPTTYFAPKLIEPVIDVAMALSYAYRNSQWPANRGE